MTCVALVVGGPKEGSTYRFDDTPPDSIRIAEPLPPHQIWAPEEGPYADTLPVTEYRRVRLRFSPGGRDHWLFVHPDIPDELIPKKVLSL